MRGPMAVGFDKYVAYVDIDSQGNLLSVQIFKLMEKDKWKKCPTVRLKHKYKDYTRKNEVNAKVFGYQDFKVVIPFKSNAVDYVRIVYKGETVPPVYHEPKHFAKM